MRCTTTGVVARITTSPLDTPAGTGIETRPLAGSTIDSSPAIGTSPAGPICETVTVPSSGVAFNTTSESSIPLETPLGAIHTVEVAPIGAPNTTEVPTY